MRAQRAAAARAARAARAGNSRHVEVMVRRLFWRTKIFQSQRRISAAHLAQVLLALAPGHVLVLPAGLVKEGRRT